MGKVFMHFALSGKHKWQRSLLIILGKYQHAQPSHTQLVDINSLFIRLEQGQMLHFRIDSWWLHEGADESWWLPTALQLWVKRNTHICKHYSCKIWCFGIFFCHSSARQSTGDERESRLLIRLLPGSGWCGSSLWTGPEALRGGSEAHRRGEDPGAEQYGGAGAKDQRAGQPNGGVRPRGEEPSKCVFNIVSKIW